MKRKKLLCLVLSLMLVILLCPSLASAEAALPEAKTLSYEDYFENEHGFYSDAVTQSKQYLNMTTGLFGTLVTKEAGGKLTRSGQEVTGIIGNSEVVFFAMNHTVYRYHVKSKRIDQLFTEPTMESFYPITSDKIMWKKATSLSRSNAICTATLSDSGSYYVFDYTQGESYPIENPHGLMALTTGSGYTNLAYYSTSINGRQIPRTVSGFRYGDTYTDYPNVGASQCQNFGIVVFSHIWGGNYTQFYSAPWYSQTNYNNSNMTAAQMYSAVSSSGAGSLVRLFNRDSSYATYHTVIITETVSGYIYVYHANMFGDNKVYITYYSQSQFNSAYKGIYYVCEP